jgi:hypothetical protein
LTKEIIEYLHKQPRDEEFEGVIADMTLANFNNKQVDTFVSKIFDSSIPSSSKMSNNQHYPKPPSQPSFGGQGGYGNGYPQMNPHMSSPNANFCPPSSMPPPSNLDQKYEHPTQGGNNNRQTKNIGEMDDKEFEGALDDFIKGLKDI